MAARSKASDCSRSVAVIAGSNPARDMDVVCFVVKVPARADHSSRGVLQSVVCLYEIWKPGQ